MNILQDDATSSENTPSIDKSCEQIDVRWGGCATWDPDEPTLWILRGNNATRANEDVHRFSLVDVIDAGLRQKIVGLSEADRDAAIAECIADIRAQWRSDRKQIDRLLHQLNDAAWQGAILNAEAENINERP